MNQGSNPGIIEAHRRGVLTGAAPTHVDSHHDVHQAARVLPQVLALVRGLEPRVPLRGHSGVRHLSQFYGQWRGDTHPERIAAEGFMELLGTVPDGVTELTCHAGYTGPDLTSSYSAERELELRTLCDQRVREAIHARGIRLIGFRDLPSEAIEPAERGDAG